MDFSQSRCGPIASSLKDHPSLIKLVEHPIFNRLRASPLSKEGTSILLGQYWHPLHGFPSFLAGMITVLPDIESKSAVSKILYQETGEGNPLLSHERVYLSTMERAGFSVEQVSGAAPLEETVELIQGYERASNDRFGALGFLFATEFSDLAIVSGIGNAVQRVTGLEDLEWVNIHIHQEPDHAEEADHTMLETFSSKEQNLIAEAVQMMRHLWIRFFDRLDTEVSRSGG